MENNENKNSTAVREDNIEVFSSHGNVVKQEKKPKYDYKMIIGIVATIVFIYSLTEDCIRFAYMGTEVSLYMYQVKGVSFASIGVALCLYSLFTNKKTFYAVSVGILALIFGYTIYLISNANVLLEEMGTFAKDHIQYGEGIVFYIVSFIIFLVNIFVPGKNALKKKAQKEVQKEIEKSWNLDGKYIFANYIFGLYKRPELFEKLSALLYNDKENSLEIFIQSDEVERISIKCEDIVSITSKSDVIMSDKPKEIRGTAADRVLINSIVGVYSPMISDELLEKLFQYDKMEYRNIFDIEIIYNFNNEERKLRFRTKESPKLFLRSFKDKYIE